MDCPICARACNVVDYNGNKLAICTCQNHCNTCSVAVLLPVIKMRESEQSAIVLVKKNEKWHLPSDSLGKNEDPIAACKRIASQAGMLIADISIMGAINTIQGIILFYMGKLVGQNKSEMIVDWFCKDELPEITNDHLLIIKNYFK